MPDPIFINYSHPSELTDPCNRTIVASFIGTFHRNRAKPSARKKINPTEVSPKNSPAATTRDQCLRGRKSLSRSRSRTSSPPTTQASSEPLPIRSIGRDKHGYRIDPFYTYPIEFSKDVSPAVDYFLQVYGPSHIIRPELLSTEAGAVVLHQYFQYALQNSLMFGALIAVAQAYLNVHRWEKGPDKDTLFHYSRSVQRLREGLSEQQGYIHEATLFAIISLMGVDLMMSDVAAYETHLGGLRQIVALRGGIDQLGWPTILKPSLIGMESLSAYMAETGPKRLTACTSPRNCSDLQHPYHRYPIAGLDELIWLLPPGFRELALNYRLSLPVMTLISRCISKGHLIDQAEGCLDTLRLGTLNAANLQETEYAIRLLVATDLTLVERSICISILMLLLHRTRKRFTSLYVQQMQHHTEELHRWQRSFDEPDLAELYLWSAVALAGTMPPRKMHELSQDCKNDNRFQVLLVVVRKYGHLSWAEILPVLQKFVMEPPCVESWRNIWLLGLKHLRET